MAKKVLFVHGTGVRQGAYHVTAAQITKELLKVCPTAEFESCLWGDLFGARLGMGGASIPEFKSPEGHGATEEETLALWQLLGNDPLFELRELAASVSPGFGPPDAEEVRQLTLQALIAFGQDRDLIERLQGYATVTQWENAVETVANAQALKDAFDTIHGGAYAPLRVAIARAVIASIDKELIDAGVPSLPRSLREVLVQQCIDRLGGTEMGGVIDWFSKRLKGFALSLATAKARRERESLYGFVAPVAGDIVLYQARGRAIRDFIEQRILACGDEVIVLAHSLGGIACVDLLIERSLPQVKALVTVGSQAPFLYEIDALSQLAFGQPLPKHFPSRWINFYDCNDLLSYRASTVFAGRAEDVEIQSNLPFPDAHSGYWAITEFWTQLQKFLA